MKTLFFSIVATFMLCMPIQAQNPGSGSNAQKILLEFGRASRDCHGFGICRFTIDITVGELIDLFQAFNNKGKLNLNISAQAMERNKGKFANNTLVIDEDFAIPTATARALGFNSYTIKKGKYVVVFDPKTNTYNCTF